VTGIPEHPRLRPLDAFPAKVTDETRICVRDPLGFTSRVLLVPYPLFFLMTLMDGEHSIRDIQAEFARKFGQIVFTEKLHEVVRMLDESLLLEGERFQRHRSGVVDAFRKQERREAIHAGGAYEAQPEALRASLRSLFEGFEPAATAIPAEPRALAGIVAPHVDLRRGGLAYAHAYREVARLQSAQTYAVFGTSHAPMERLFAITRKAYDTPLGALEVDREVVDALERRLGFDLYRDELNHRAEHSIEFQAVFLRYLFDGRPAPRIVPILCGSLHRCLESGTRPAEVPEFAEFTAALREILNGCSACLVAGADLAHVGLKFGDPEPPDRPALAALEARDVAMLRCVENLDAEGFFRSVHEDGDRRRICGFSPILALMAILDAREGKILQYSQALEPDTGSVVTYAAMAFYR
jgi:AmmeMemoRadiSam system protein B